MIKGSKQSKSAKEKMSLHMKGRTPWNKGVKGYNSGNKHPMWKGGINKMVNGYLRDLIVGKGKYELEHRKIIEQLMGRKLTKEEVVHHIDGNRTNNHINNLVLMTRSEHQKLHYKNRKRNERGIFI